MAASRKRLAVAGLAVIGLLAVLAVSGRGEPRVARHGLSAAQYQVDFDRWVAKGYRLTSVDGDEVAGVVRYAATWERKAGPPWQARHGLTAAQYRRTVDALGAEGYRPVLLDTYATGGGARFAAIFQKD